MNNRLTPSDVADRKIAWHFSFRYIIASLGMLFVTVILFSVFFHPSTEPDAKPADAPAAEKPVIVIDAGHGGEDSGAIGVSGVYEKDLNLAVAGFLADCFREAGYTVKMTREDDRLLYTEEQDIPGKRKQFDLANRVLIAESYPNAIFVSIHMNSFTSERYSGLQVWYAPSGDTSSALANAVMSEVRARVQPDNTRTARCGGSDMYVLNRATYPAILVECGFLSHPQECEKLSDEAYQKELSSAIFCGMMKVIGTEVSR